jgi:hypothetical protein
VVSPGLCSGAISFLSSKAAVVGAGRWARLYTAGRGRRGGGLPALPLHHPTKKLPRRSSSPARPAARAHVPPPASHAAARGGGRMIDRSIDRSSRARRLARSSGRGSRRGGVHRPAASGGSSAVSFSGRFGGRSLVDAFPPCDHCEFRLPSFCRPLEGSSRAAQGRGTTGPRCDWGRTTRDPEIHDDFSTTAGAGLLVLVVHPDGFSIEAGDGRTRLR